MSGNKNKFFAIIQSIDIITCFCKNLFLLFSQSSIVLKLIHDHVKCINHSITCHIDITMSLLFQQILF